MNDPRAESPIEQPESSHEETRPTRNMQWPHVERDAIHQWRDLTTRPSRHLRVRYTREEESIHEERRTREERRIQEEERSHQEQRGRVALEEERNRQEQRHREEQSHRREEQRQREQQRSTEEPQRRRDESQPRSTYSLRSNSNVRVSGSLRPMSSTVSLNSLYSDGSLSSSSGKRFHDVSSNLKCIVRGFLRTARGRTTRDERRKECTDPESYVPSPKITFLIDNPDNLVCQICTQTRLKIAITAETPGPDIPSLLPCGHIFCHGCIDAWLVDKKSCPMCRMTLVHKNCQHGVEPRLIAQDTIHTLPLSLPAGGKIGDKCLRCADKDRRKYSAERWARLAESFKVARSEAERLGTEDAVEGMRRAQKSFERLPEDDYWALSRMRHHQW